MTDEAPITGMAGTYRLEFDHDRRMLRITFAGFFGVGDLEGYGDAKRAALSRLGCAPNAHVTLCDLSVGTPQSPAVLELFGRSLNDPRPRSWRMAIVIGSTLLALHVTRAVTRPDTATARTVDDAERWLFDDP